MFVFVNNWAITSAKKWCIIFIGDACAWLTAILVRCIVQ